MWTTVFHHCSVPLLESDVLHLPADVLGEMIKADGLQFLREDFLHRVHGRSLEICHHGSTEARGVCVTLMYGCAHFAQHL